MPRLRRIRRTGWKHLLDLAASRNKDDRVAAIVRAYAWIEDALDAANVPKGKSIASRILSTLQVPAVAGRLSRVQIEEMLTVRRRVQPAINVRHRMAHQDTIPSIDECSAAVSTLRDVWHALGRDFVTMDTAITLAERMVKVKGVGTVCLFGSMARGELEPNDLDFLLLGLGEFEHKVSPEYEEGKVDTVFRTNEALEYLQLTERSLLLAAKCRWLDVAVINGTRFGIDRDYTVELRDSQADPWFFEHIALELLSFDARQRIFVEPKEGPFRELHDILLRLQAFGLR